MSFERKSFDEQHYLYVEKTCEYKDIASHMEAAFLSVFALVNTQGITPLSAPMTLYMAMPNGPQMTFRGGVIVSAEDAAKASGEVLSDTIAAGEAMHTIHTGSYADLGKTHQALWKAVEESGAAPKMPVWELYIDDPTAMS